MTQATVPTTTTPPAEADKQEEGWSIQRIATITTVTLVAVVVIIFVAGLLLALLTDIQQTQPRVQVVRDIVIMIIAIEGIIIVVALGALVVQVARLINLLKTGVTPILDNAQAAAKSAKGTADFVGDNVTEPIIKASGFLAGLRVMIIELGGIRRAIRRSRDDDGKQA